MNLLARLQFNHARCLFFPSLFRRIPIWPSFKQVSNVEAQASAVNDYSKNTKKLPCRAWTSDTLLSIFGLLTMWVSLHRNLLCARVPWQDSEPHRAISLPLKSRVRFEPVSHYLLHFIFPITFLRAISLVSRHLGARVRISASLVTLNLGEVSVL